MSVILVTGSRSWQWPDVIYNRLLICKNADLPLTVMIHGDAEGADSMARESMFRWNQTRRDGLFCVQVPVPYFSWSAKAGGHERNRVMLHVLKAYEKYGCHVHVEAFSVGEISYVKRSPRNVFGGTGGTCDMVQQALDAGVRVHLTWTEAMPEVEKVPGYEGCRAWNEKWLEPKPRR